MSSPLATTALDNWTLDIISISIVLQLASIMPVPGVAYCIPVGPETRKLFLSKCIHSQRDPLPARAFETLYIIQLGVRQQAGDDESRSGGTVRRHDDEVVLGNTRQRVLTSPVRPQQT